MPNDPCRSEGYVDLDILIKARCSCWYVRSQGGGEHEEIWQDDVQQTWCRLAIFMTLVSGFKVVPMLMGYLLRALDLW